MSEHFNVQQSQIGNKLIASSVFCLVFDVEIAGIRPQPVDQPTEGVLANAIEMKCSAVIGYIVRITDNGTLASLWKSRRFS